MKKERIFWGVFLILGAIFILVAKLGFLQGVGIWSLIWSVFFAAVLIKSIMKVNFFGIFLSLAFFLIIYAGPLDAVIPWPESFSLQAITPWPVLGAAVLLGLGFGLIFPKKNTYKWCVKEEGHFTAAGGERIINEADAGSCGCSVHFGSTIKYINSDAFESAKFDVSFGGLKVFFDNAVMKGTEAYVLLDNKFGGTELYVPKEWTVINQVDNVFAGVDEKGRSNPDGRHNLYLQGSNNFGGITIIYI